MTQAIELAREAHFIGGQVIMRGFMSSLYMAMGDPAAAERVAQAGVDLARVQLPQFAAMCIGTLIRAQLQQGNLAGATANLQDPLAWLEHQQFFAEHDMLVARAEHALAQGDLSLAIDTAHAAVERLDNLGYTTWVPEILDVLARAYVANGETDEARRVVEETVTRARGIGLHVALWNYLAELAELEEDAGAQAVAETLYDEARAEIEALLPTIWPDDLRESFLAKPRVREVLARVAAPSPSPQGEQKS